MSRRSRPHPRLVLALDTGSRVVSFAVGDRDRTLAETSLELSRSSASLLRLVDETLEAAGVRLQDLPMSPGVVLDALWEKNGKPNS